MRRKFQSAIKYAVLAMVLTLATGCENPYLVQLKDEFGWTEARMLRDGWLKTYPIAQPQIYCYHTLGDADCYPEPTASHRDRLTNASDLSDF